MNRLPHIWIMMLIFILRSCIDSGSGIRTEEGDELTVSTLQIGVSYYPEQRPREVWNVDFEMLVQAGIKRIRIGEFAWSTIEPAEGQFDFHRFDACIELARRYGIEVVMCTPTAAPPVWLIEKNPEILPVNADHERNTFGARQHRCYNTELYIQLSERIVEKLAARYSNHPNVVAWQIDNEMGGEQKRCFCDHCREKFQSYLKNEYGDIESLNRRWGNAFWSLDYQNFRQIVLPYRYNATLMLKHHPSLELEFSRFCSASIVQFSDMQAAIIKKYNQEALVTTNRFAYEWGDNVNSFDLNKNLDVAGFDLYSTEKHQIAFYADINRSLCNDHNWVLEFGTNSPDLIAEMELMESRGVQWLYLFKLNPFPAGMEQSNRALLTITGKPTENYYLVKKWNDERNTRKTVKPREPETGIYYDFNCSWALFQEGWGSYREKLVYQSYLIDTVYRAVYSASQPIRIFHTPDQFEKVKTLILPHQVIYSPELEELLISFLQIGGTVITTHDLFWKNEDNVFLTQLPGIYHEIMEEEADYILVPPSDPVVFNHGKGKFVMVSGDAGYEDWIRYYKKFNHPM